MRAPLEFINQIRETIESYVVYLRHDLKIADTCQSTRASLLAYLRDETTFSKQFTDQFQQADSNAPFIISDNDPSQVVLFKKLLNALANSEQAFRKIEGLDIGKDVYTHQLTGNVAKTVYQTIHELYATVQIINHSGRDIQMMIGPI